MKRPLFFLFLLQFLVSLSFSQTWPQVASNYQNWRAFELDPSGNAMFIGGPSPVFNTQTVNYILQWDGTNATALGNGVHGGLSPLVTSLTYFNNQLIAGGKFDSAGTISAKNIALWNGTAWQNLTQGTNAEVNSLKVFNGELYAGGNFTMAGSTPAVGIAKWNGTSWSAVGTGFTDSVVRLEVFNGALYAATQSARIYKWSGSSWSFITSFSSGSGTPQLACLQNVGNNKLYCGGTFDMVNGNIPADLIAMYDGTSWSAVGNANFGGGQWPWPGVYGMTENNGSLFITGLFDSLNNGFANSFASWNGSTWTTIGSGPGDGTAIEVFGGSFYVGARNFLRRCDSTLAVHELSEPREIEMFPNPARTTITIRPYFDFLKADIQIIDVLGRVWLSQHQVELDQPIDIENLPEGLYFVQIRGKSGASQVRFIKLSN